MGTVEDVVKIATTELGTKEYPFNSNSVKYNDWYYGKHVEGSAYPWCMVFVQWVFNKVDVKLPKKTASCRDLMNAAKHVNQFVTKDYKVGDVLLYSFTATNRMPTHCGILVDIASDSAIDRYIAIEGNTSNSNEANGGEVMKKRRRMSQIVGAVRPIFSEKVEDDMDVSKLTDKEAYEILKKAMAYAEKLPEPAWSIQNGSWKNALERKIVTTNSPEGLVRRDQLTKILQDLGVL